MSGTSANRTVLLSGAFSAAANLAGVLVQTRFIQDNHGPIVASNSCSILALLDFFDVTTRYFVYFCHGSNFFIGDNWCFPVAKRVYRMGRMNL